MRIVLSALTLTLTLILPGCRPTDLERPGVPISWGMRFESDADVAELNPNMAKLRSLVMRRMLVELPVVADSQGLPTIPPLSLDRLRGYSNRYKVRLFLAFTTTNPKKLFPLDTVEDPNRWFAALETAVDSVLRDFGQHPPERVIIGSNWTYAEQYGAHWKQMLDKLRGVHPYLFSYGASLQRLPMLDWLNACDEICIDYRPGPDENPKPYAREYNQMASAIADSLDLPVFIFRTNLIGNNKTLQLKNQLRFWSEGVNVRGLCINTLYAPIAARDSTTYYGVAQEDELFEFLRRYRER